MNPRVKCILTLGLAIFFTANLYLAADYYSRFKTRIASLQQIDNNIENLKHKLQMTRQVLTQAGQVRTKLDKIDKRAFTPAKWMNFPLLIQKKMPMSEVPTVTETMSQGRPQPSNYWFKPESFMISVAGTSERDEEKEPQRQFSINAQGSFLIPPEKQ
ncbi:MAG: hypothetical protein ACQES5_10180 [Thermodesulfobacteriota bacterium]